MLVGFCAPSVRAACRAHAVRPKAALPGSSSYRYLPKADPFFNRYFVRWKCLPSLAVTRSRVAAASVRAALLPAC